MTFLKRKIKGRPKIAPVIDDGRPPSCFQSLRNTVTTFTKDERFDSFINYVRQPSPPCAAIQRGTRVLISLWDSLMFGRVLEY